MSTDDKAPQPLTTQGWTSTVYLLPTSPPKICKSFNKQDASELYGVEKAAYERFSDTPGHNPAPSSILKYYGVHPTLPRGLILEYASHHDLSKRLWDQRQLRCPVPPTTLLYHWAHQAASALEFAHNLGVYNSDIHLVNLFLMRS